MITHLELYWCAVLFSKKNNQGAYNIKVFMWYPDLEALGTLQKRVSLIDTDEEAQVWFYDDKFSPVFSKPGCCYEQLVDIFCRAEPSFKNFFPEDFELTELLDSPNVFVYDDQNNLINHTHPLVTKVPRVRPSHGKVSDLGRFLSGADKYSIGPDGEVGGPSGFEFI